MSLSLPASSDPGSRHAASLLPAENPRYGLAGEAMGLPVSKQWSPVPACLDPRRDVQVLRPMRCGPAGMKPEPAAARGADPTAPPPEARRRLAGGPGPSRASGAPTLVTRPSQEKRRLHKTVGGEAPGATGAPRSGGRGRQPRQERPSRSALTTCLEVRSAQRVVLPVGRSAGVPGDPGVTVSSRR